MIMPLGYHARMRAATPMVASRMGEKYSRHHAASAAAYLMLINTPAITATAIRHATMRYSFTALTIYQLPPRHRDCSIFSFDFAALMPRLMARISRLDFGRGSSQHDSACRTAGDAA